ncbi:MAG: hypothetical protein OHK0038_16120 [Flammeovirgaceae bacterium]
MENSLRPESKLPFGKKNYRLMLIGLAVLLTGFVLMSVDKETFGFGFLGLTLGPLVVMAGFAMQFFAILQNDEKKN